MSKVHGLSVDRLRDVLSYDADTGIFRWRVALSRRISVGRIAGARTSHGYAAISIDGRHYYAHQLAWFYVHGAWPDRKIDHKRGRKNNIANLRLATDSQNCVNRRAYGKSGFKGVYWAPHANKWFAQIKEDGRSKFLGYFDDPRKANAVFFAAAKKLHGEFANAG